MSAQDNATKLGVPNKNLVFETAGRIYVKVQDRFYELDFRNQGKGTGDTKIEIVNNTSNAQEVDMSGYVTKEFLKASLSSYVTKRSWNDVKETMSMIQNAQLEGFTEAINPITVQTMQVVVGSDDLQYEFVDGFKYAREEAYGPILSKNGIEFPEAYIKHYSLDGPTEIRPQDGKSSVRDIDSEALLQEYCRWHIASNYFDLGAPEASYYVYIKVPRLKDNDGWINSSNPMTINTKTNAEGTSVYDRFGLGKFVLSNTAIERDSEYGYYHLLYGIINSDSDGNGRSFSTMNGFTEILPGQITAYIFKSASGDSYLDLRKNELKLGDAFQWNINNNNILYIKGAIVVDDGGNESYMYLDRGIFHRYRYPDNGGWKEVDRCDADVHIQGNVYYRGNTVVWTNDKGITSTYMYIGPNSNPDGPEDDKSIHADGTCITDPESVTTYIDPTNETYWRVLAKGVRGYSNLIADLSNEMEAIACDKDGYVINEDGLTVTTQATLYYGSSEVELHSTESGNTITFDGIIIDTHEIDNLNPQPEDPEAPRNPELTYRILDTEPASYSKIIEFTIPHGLKLPEKGEISITMKSKNQYGEEDNDTRPIVFTLVGVRSGKAYNLVPSTRTIQRNAQGLFSPNELTCNVVCNGSDGNIATDDSEIIVKRIFDDSEIINGEERDFTWINSHLLDFINDEDSTWDWVADGYEDKINLTQGVAFDKITFFLYYKDPLSTSENPRWVLCDKETIFVVKDGLLGQDLSLISSSQVFSYAEESSRTPLNSQITLTASTQNITVKSYTWEYRTPGEEWTEIKEIVEGVEVLYNHESLTILGPILDNNRVDLRDFIKYFPNASRLCEFRVTILYDDLNQTNKTLTDFTSIHIIKGGDGALTIYLTNPSMIFASTEKKGVSFGLAETTEVVGYYGINQILTANNISASVSKYVCNDADGNTYIYDGLDGRPSVSYYEENIINCVKVYSPNTYTTSGRLYVTVNTGEGDVNTPFQINNKPIKSGEIYLSITVNFGDNQTETVERVIYWSTVQQGEIGIAKQPRGRSDWNVKGYTGQEMYQGTQDVEDNWDGDGQAWNEKKNIFFDIIKYGSGSDAPTYYCKFGGKAALYGDPSTDNYKNKTRVLSPDENTYAWTRMTYANIASSVAWIDQALIENLTLGKLQTKIKENATTDIVKIENNFIKVIDGDSNTIVSISSDALPSGSGSPSGTFSFGGSKSVGKSGETYSFGSVNSITNSNNTVTIPSFQVNLNFSTLNTSTSSEEDIGIGLTIRAYILGYNGYGNTHIFELGDMYSESLNVNNRLNVSSYTTSFMYSYTYILYVEVIYDAITGTKGTLSVSDTTATIKYLSNSANGTLLGGNGFQVKWGYSGLRTLNDTGSQVYQQIGSNKAYDWCNIVGSKDIKAIFVSDSTPGESSPDGLYFCY